MVNMECYIHHIHNVPSHVHEAIIISVKITRVNFIKSYHYMDKTEVNAKRAIKTKKGDIIIEIIEKMSFTFFELEKRSPSLKFTKLCFVFIFVLDRHYPKSDEIGRNLLPIVTKQFWQIN